MDKTSPNVEKVQPHPHSSILYKHIQLSILSTAQPPQTPIPTPKGIPIPMFASSSCAITLLQSFPKKTRFPGKKIAASYTTRENRAPCSFPPKMASPASLYEVLGISMTADSHEIKAAYRKLARTFHPDVVAMNQKQSSANEFMKIHSAYSTLSDPYKRAQYDREIYGHRKQPLNYSNLSMAGFGQAGRNWETDQCW